MSYGISTAGFNRKTLQVMLAEVAEDYRGEIGDVNDADDSVFSQVVRPLLTQLASAWETLEAVYQSGGPNGAEGVSLDHIAAQNLITRIAARATRVQAVVTGTPGTTVPAGTQASISGTGAVFEAEAETVIDQDAALRALITVAVATASVLYRVTINGVNHDYTPGASPTVSTIRTGLLAAIAAGAQPVTAAAVDGTTDQFQIDADDLDVTFTIAVPDNAPSADRLEIDAVYSPQMYEALETGATLCLTGTLDTIDTPVSGLDEITNLQDGVLGRAAETDTELRVRRTSTLARAGRATLAAITAKLISGDVDGVTQVLGYENVGDATDGDGRPPHSIEMVVLGGTDADVAEAIHETRAAGIKTHGNVNGGAGITIEDAQGFDQVVEFSRPVERFAWIDFEYSLYAEEDFPADGEDQIAAAALAYANANFGIGKDFLLQRFVGPAMIAGVGSVVVTIATTSTEGGTPSYGGSNLAVGPSEVLVFDSARITVAEA